MPPRSASASPAEWSGRAWKSRLGRRLAFLFGFAALVPGVLLGVLSFREVNHETAELNQRNRFQFTKASAMYLRYWLDTRVRELDFTAHHLIHRHHLHSEGVGQRTPNGRLRIERIGSVSTLSPRERAVLEEGRPLIRTVTIDATRARILLLRRIELDARPALVTYALDTAPPLDAVLPAEYAFCVLNERRAVVHCSTAPPAAWRSAIASVQRRGGFQEAKLVGRDGSLLLTSWNLFMDEGFGVGDWRVMTWQSDDFVAYSAADFLRSHALALALAVTTVLLLTLVALRRSLTPIQRLTAFAQELTHGNLHARLDLSTGDEIERVGNAFNLMAARLESHFRMLERYSEVERAILAGASPAQVTGLLFDQIDGADGESLAIALRLNDEVAIGVRVGSAAPYYVAAEVAGAGIEAVFDGDGTRALAECGLWAAPLRAHGTARVIARRVQATDAVAIIRSGAAGAHRESSDDPLVKGLVERLVMTLDNRAIERKLVYQSFHDGLTDLPNRESLLASLPTALSRAQQGQTGVALLVIDLDDFRVVNETLGFRGGDAVLVQIGARLRALAEANCQVLHLRADVFALLLADIPNSEDGALAELRGLVDTVQTHLVAPLTVDSTVLHLSASFGAAVYPRDATQGDDLLKKAEQAVERAKQGVIHQRVHFYADEMNRRSSHALILRSELQQAIERRSFVVHYQPKVDAVTERVVGCEALVRWQHPARGLVMPGDFIVEAERSGLIVEIGQQVLEEACRQLQAWRMQFPLDDFRVSVNVAARQFEAPDLDARVQSALRSASLPAAALELEITETVACADMARTLEFLDRLRGLGVGLSLDDFGTGHSSLRYLQRMPINALKIDRSFVVEIGKGPKGEAVIDSVLTLCQRLGLVSIAEGVETAAQAAYLRGRGCNLIQGYLYGRPGPAGAFAALLAAPPAVAQSTRLVAGAMVG